MSGAKRSNFIILLIGAIAAFPLVGSYLLYRFWEPDQFVNYGELFGPVQIAEGQAPVGFDAIQGKWAFLMVDSGACDTYCQRKLYIMRQVRLTQGEDMRRVERVWLVDDDQRPAPQLFVEYKGTQVIAPGGSELLARLSAQGSPRDYLFVIDPLGNVMMRYPRDPDPSLIKKDLKRLLKASRVG